MKILCILLAFHLEVMTKRGNRALETAHGLITTEPAPAFLEDEGGLAVGGDGALAYDYLLL